jgi:hypothetical protein
MGNDKNQKGAEAESTSDISGDEKAGTVMTPCPPQGWHAEEKDHRRKESNFWLAYIVLTILTVGGAGASAFFAYGAYKASGRQVTAAETQIGVAKDTEQRQLRAYLYVDHGSLSPVGPIFVPGTPTGAIIHLHSAGATPAYKLRVAATVEIGEFPLPKGKLSDPLKRSGEGITRASYPILYGSEPIDENVIVRFLPEALALLKSDVQHYRFYLFGGVRYFDIFGIEDPKLERHYDFCFSFEPDPNSPITAAEEDGCDEYNKPG